MTTLGEDLPKEQERVRDLLVMYASLGPNCGYAMAVLNRALKEADEAVISGDVVRMIRAYQALKECQ